MCKTTHTHSTKQRVALKALSANIKASSQSPSRKRSIRQRKVCFSFDQENTAPSPVKEITHEHNTNAWYSKGEISSFKAHTKSLVVRGLPSEDETFGMERFLRDRSQQKKSTVRYVVLSQKVNKDPEFQSYISRRNSSTSKETALNQALENFCDVYDPLSSLLEGGDNYNDCFFANKNDDGFNLTMIDQASSQEPTRSIAIECC
ncbi:MAG: hypothetical protein SGBAC_007255 [Bacillariaceae sp.]